MRACLVALPLMLLGLASPAIAWDVAEDPENNGYRVTAWDDDSDNRGFQLALTCNDTDPASAELYLYTGAPWNEALAKQTSESLKLEVDGKDYPYQASFVQAGGEAAIVAGVASDKSITELFRALGLASSSITLTYGGVIFTFDTDQVRDSVGTFLDKCVITPGNA